MTKLYSLIFITLSSLLSISGDTLLVAASKNHKSMFTQPLFWAGVVLYFFVAVVWVVIYRTQKFAVANALYSLILLISTPLIGTFFFKEQLVTRQYVGLVLAGIAMFLL